MTTLGNWSCAILQVISRPTAKQNLEVLRRKDRRMTKVVCVECWEVGFTASPQSTRCKCGGRLTAIDEHTPNNKEEESNENFTYSKQ
jgi:hypothetical protein